MGMSELYNRFTKGKDYEFFKMNVVHGKSCRNAMCNSVTYHGTL